ncbi:Starch-binding associating with outer membrane [Mariniphaga anaerophila]|uniref:Starch-binding associating with outer membrane n=1 Tax=Mariniphaga anaerophila TaxID=1484053 RepID=A0A1M5F9K5_9BACT|nr:RagB/SusD family nutrient uptake outer membrane protein [Mariniphaga anaerophila]SHF88156.1 Starch-binding associating with outer membrane [Mariniphaga anaerophila]
MKNNILITLILVAVFFAGCDDSFLEEATNPNALTSESFWQKEEDALKGLTSAYATLQPSMGWAAPYEQYIVTENYRTDELDWRDDVTSWIRLASFTNEPANDVSSQYWNYQFQGVFRANQCIEGIPQIPEISPDVLENTVAEARFLRAFFYFNLLRNFGERLPLYKVAFGGTQEHYYPPQASPGEIVSFIETELKAVQEILPESYDAENAGRATKWAATAILAKLYLWQGSYADAVPELKKIVDSEQFDLVTDYGHLWDARHKNSSESILEVQFSGDRTGSRREFHWITIHLASFNIPGGGYEEAYPSQWLFNLMKKDTTETGEYGDRILETIMFNSPQSTAYYYGENEFTNFHSPNEIFWKKHVTFPEDLTDYWYYSITNIPLVRYADVLLLYAEALNETEGPSSLVFECINRVRNRSHVVPVPETMSKEQVREHLRHVERPCELALEGSRWYDLVRWGVTQETLLAHGKRGAENFVKGKHEIFPLPYKEMLLNREWEQNSGFGK